MPEWTKPLDGKHALKLMRLVFPSSNGSVQWKSGTSLKYLNLWISQLGVVAGSEVALSRMSLKEGGEGGVLVNTASLAGVRVLQMLRPFLKTETFVNLPTTFWTTRPKPAYGRQGLDWIVGPGYSFVVFSLSIDFFCICSLWIARKQTFFVTNRGLHLTFMTQLEKVIIFCYKQTFSVTHGGSQLTF